MAVKTSDLKEWGIVKKLNDMMCDELFGPEKPVTDDLVNRDYWDDEIRNLKDRIEAQDKRIEELEAAINDWHYAIVDWEGCDFIERISNPTHRKVIEDVVNARDTLREEKSHDASA